jgi:hypothetical protein
VRSTTRKIVLRVLLFVAVIVLMSAVSIWFGFGPAVLSP